jgi:hypothetical protein
MPTVASSRSTGPALPRFILAALAFLSLTACESDRSERPDRSAAATPAPDSAVPEMEAHGLFFAGEIEVQVLLNRAGFAGRGAGDADSASSSGGPGGNGPGGSGPGGNGGGGMHGGGHRRSGQSGDSSPGGAGGDAGGDMTPHIRVSNLPPVRLHLRLINHGPTQVAVEVPDFNSDLGNFVVQPPKIALPPGNAVDADPMTSRLGVSSDEIPLTVSLLLNGHRERQVLTLEPTKPAVAPPVPKPES